MTGMQKSRLYRFVSGGIGIYEAVERHCPRSDERRANKPDGAWLPKVGPKFPGAISFWTRYGLEQYENSGLRDWHESVCAEPAEILLSQTPGELLYQGDFQIICDPSSVQPLRVRVARPGDEFGIAQVHVQAWNETYAGLIPDDILKSRRVEEKVKQWEQAIATSLDSSSKKRLWVAEDPSGQIIGMNMGGPSRDTSFGYDAELYAIYLLKEFQGSGAGALLFRELTRWLGLRGFARMMLWVLEGNPTIHFYERAGGKFLSKSKEVDFAGTKCQELAYGWELQKGSLS